MSRRDGSHSPPQLREAAELPVVPKAACERGKSISALLLRSNRLTATALPTLPVN
jgi:hypothetical protein